MNIFEEIKKIIAEADAKIQAVIQPSVESGSDKLVELANKAIRTVQQPIKSIMVGLDKDWTQVEKDAQVVATSEAGGPPESTKDMGGE